MVARARRFGIDYVVAKPWHDLELLGVAQRNLRPDGPPASIFDQDYETPLFDLKEVSGLGTRNGAAALAKDVIAMANSGGGDIVMGWRDEGNNVFTPVGLAPTELELLEVTRLNQSLQPFLDPPLHVAVRVAQREHLWMAHLHIEPSAVLVMPKHENPEARLFLGRIYVRTDSCQSAQASTSDEVRRVVDHMLRLRS